MHTAVKIFDVGQGDGILIKCPTGEVIMMDLGSSQIMSPNRVTGIRTQLLRYIRSELPYNDTTEAYEIDLLIISHSDVDHYSMIPALMKGIKKSDKPVHVKECVFADAPESYSKAWRKFTTEYFGYFLGGIEPLSKQAISSTNPWKSFGDVKLYIVAANVSPIKKSNKRKKSGSSTTKSSHIANTNSAVILLVYKDHKVMLAGDSTTETEGRILAAVGANAELPALLKLDEGVLKVAHHGSITSSSPTWLGLISPGFAVISAGINDYKHPDKRITDQLEVMPSMKDVGADLHRYVCCSHEDEADFEWLNPEAKKETYTTIMQIAAEVKNEHAMPSMRRSYCATLPVEAKEDIEITPFEAKESK